MLTLDTPLASLRNISPAVEKRLRRMGIATVRDLLWHFPSRYEDFSQVYRIRDLEPEQHATIHGVIRKTELRRTWKRRLTVFEAVIEDETGKIKVVWFNQPYLTGTLREGLTISAAGKVAVDEKGVMYLAHPSFEFFKTQTDTDQLQTGADAFLRKSPYRLRQSTLVHTGRLVPVYPETRDLTSKGIRSAVQFILKNLPRLTEWLPWQVLRKERLIELNRALRAIHFPASFEEAGQARRRFAFEDLFLLQLANLEYRLALNRGSAPTIPFDIEWFKDVLRRLPFTLTPSQKKALWDILKDLAKPHPMNRLLQGDVGSGKTVVAALAALVASRVGCQTAIMAPTDVLANQHFETFKTLYRRLDPEDQPQVALLTASAAKIFRENDRETVMKKTMLIKKIHAGDIMIVIGTHALIQKSVTFNQLGFVVVDEQHRFGVRQRAALLKNKELGSMDYGTEKSVIRNPQSVIPHLLSMSATPIPRTLTLALFGDLDVSNIVELPAGRRRIETRIVSPGEREEAYRFIRAQVEKGRQAFVICPRIEADQRGLDNDVDSHGTHPRASASNYSDPRHSTPRGEAKAVKAEYEKLSKRIFPDFRVGILHGQLKPREKERAMKAFKDGEIDILVSTTVIEVGVDIPNATVMAIEGAERFGLAQLYQLRGRVGRGEHQSHCLLFTDSDARSAHTRLNTILEAANGFELAERDLKLRGPGEFFGERQTGLPDVAMQSLKDLTLVKSSRAAALDIIREDPSLSRWPLLRLRLEELTKRLHRE